MGLRQQYAFTLCFTLDVGEDERCMTRVYFQFSNLGKQYVFYGGGGVKRLNISGLFNDAVRTSHYIA